MNRLILRSLVTLSLLCFSLVAARQARADSVSYTYAVGSDTFAWLLPASPASVLGFSSVCGSGMCSFTIPGASFTENGAPMTGTLDFFDSASGGGFDLFVGTSPTGTPPFLVDNSGAVLFTGPVTGPTMSAFPSGVSLLEFPDSLNPGATGTLTATVVSTTIPEPPTILLAAIGLVIGLALTVLRKN
jgi:hypothetical protein